MIPFIIAIIAVVVAVLLWSRRLSGRHSALDSTRFLSFPLTKKTTVSHDTFIFRFALPSPECVLGLPIGKHIYLRATVHSGEREELVQHAYTPISSDDERGYVDFLIKVYRRDVHPKFPNGGRLTQYLDGLKIGDRVDMKGPLGKFEYHGNGRYTIQGQKGGSGAAAGHVTAFVMVAGGTGITPMMQIIRAILKDPKDRTVIHLVYGNQTEDDILLREELDACASADSRVTVWYTIDRDASPTWKYDVGYVSEAMFKKHLPRATPGEVLALMCGPPPMIQYAIKPNLEKLGYTADMMFSF